MKAVVLVGGQGTRLRPLTLTTPKQMLPVAGRPMLEWVVSHLAEHGVDEVILSLGYRTDAFLATYPDNHCAGVRLRYAVEPEPLDTGGGIAFAARLLGIDETFVVQNGDVLTGLDLGRLVDFHRHCGAAATVSLTPVDEPCRYGVVDLDPTGRVTAFIEKPAPGQAPTNLINAGTYVLEPDVVGSIPCGRRVSIERETFPQLVGRGSLYALASDEDWIDAGTVATYLDVNLAMANREQRWVDELAQVDKTAQVAGSVVAAGAVVGKGARIERALVMSCARVGREATVRDSIIGPGAVVGDRATIEALTIVGYGASVDAGTVASGARIPNCLIPDSPR